MEISTATFFTHSRATSPVNKRVFEMLSNMSGWKYVKVLDLLNFAS